MALCLERLGLALSVRCADIDIDTLHRWKSVASRGDAGIVLGGQKLRSTLPIIVPGGWAG